jgi:hypothetical protein
VGVKEGVLLGGGRNVQVDVAEGVKVGVDVNVGEGVMVGVFVAVPGTINGVRVGI